MSAQAIHPRDPAHATCSPSSTSAYARNLALPAYETQPPDPPPPPSSLQAQPSSAGALKPDLPPPVTNYSKDLPTYLKYCKDVVFAGSKASFGNHEEDKMIEYLWNFIRMKRSLNRHSPLVVRVPFYFPAFHNRTAKVAPFYAAKMAPVTRRALFPKVVIERDSDSEQSSSSSSEEEEPETLEEEEEEEEEGVTVSGNGNAEKLEVGSDSKRKGKAPITISLKKVCKVCKKPGHEAGFKGATYIDCPMKPCFLCKMPGHTTLTCPHRVSTEHGVIPAPRKRASKPLEYVFERQLRAAIPSIKPKYVIPDQVNCAVIRYHSRRVTCLEFHPTKNNILLSGDKKGQLGVWDFGKVHERVVYGNIHSCILNNMRFNPTNDCMVYSASSDGTISCTDLETGISSSPMNLNPDGWQGPSTWKMLYGMDINCEKGLVLVADNFGFLHLVDTRSNHKTGDAILIHKKRSKVVGLHCNPIQPDLLLSCGNDHFARIWDLRRIEARSSLYELKHRRVVNSAYFSPLSGSKILTTSQDNRLRIWDSIFGNMDSPSREIVHSHDFNRHLTPFKAEWDPKDPSESLAVVGRYISENYKGAALHPIDFIDISTGQLLAEVMDPNITTISPVNKLHPRDDILASGSSRSLFIWKPKETSEPVEDKDERKIVVCGRAEKKRSKKGDDGDESDDDAFISKLKKSKSRKTNWKLSRRTTKDSH